jgi:HNH endonuclease
VAFSLTTIKTLFALSCNRCAYPGCEEALTDPGWGQVKADIAHIRGDRPGSARYDASMSDDDRDAYENLLLLCPNHHRLVDRLDPHGHPVDRLIDIKQRAESSCRDHEWAPRSDLERFAHLVVAASDTVIDTETRVERPRLTIKVSDRHAIEVTNVGDADALELSLEPLDDETRAATTLADVAPGRLSPGATWRAGFHTATFGHPGPHVVRLSWKGSNGTAYDGEFPL